MRQTATVLIIVLAIAGCANKANLQKIQEDGIMLRMDLANVMVKSGAYEAAVPLLQRLITEAPSDVKARVLFATVLRQSGLYGQAVAQYKESIRLEPRSATAYSGLGITYSRMGQHQDAIRAHKRAVELAPRSAEMWNNLGFALYASGDPKHASTALEHALVLDPASHIAFNNLGFAYGKQARYDDALRVFRSALGESRAYMNLALVYEQAGDDKHAAQCRATAHRLDFVTSSRTATKGEP
jgi:Flp pilus assembly protein TadD